MRIVPPVTLVAFVSVTSGCTEDRPDHPTWSVDTLANGATVVRNSAVGLWGEDGAWQLTEHARIGTRNEYSPEAFGEVRDLDVGPDGRVYVLDWQAQEIQVFDADGSFVRTIGRWGHGPGEFSGANGIALDPAGRLWVFNQANLRYAVFDTSGTLVRETRREVGRVSWVTWGGVFSEDGNLYDLLGNRSPAGEHLPNSWARYDTITMRFVDSLPLPPYPEGTEFGWGVRTPTHDGWWVDVKNQYRLWKTTRASDTVRIVEREYEPARLTHAEQDSAQYEADSLERRARGAFDAYVPTNRRIFETMFTDDRDYLWVLLTPDLDDSGSKFDVFDPEGRYLGALSVPDRIRRDPLLVIRGDWMAYLTKDALDVPYVVLVRIVDRDQS